MWTRLKVKYPQLQTNACCLPKGRYNRRNPSSSAREVVSSFDGVGAGGQFQTTLWSVLLQAAKEPSKGNRTFAVTLVDLRRDDAGEFIGTSKIRSTLTLDETSARADGQFEISVFDLGGNQVGGFGGTFEATRIQSEPLNLSVLVEPCAILLVNFGGATRYDSSSFDKDWDPHPLYGLTSGCVRSLSGSATREPEIPA